MLSDLKRNLRSSFPLIFQKFSILNKKIKRIPRHPIQKLINTGSYNIIHLGTQYGGWKFVDDDSLTGSTIISAGLGEDASFDVEFASRYDATVIIVDPTPRAINHFKQIQDAFGCEATQKYSQGGCQPISAYDLSRVNDNNFRLITKALWDQNTNIKFFEPPNPSHVSHSIINYQNHYSNDTNFIQVEAVTLDTLLSDLNLEPSNIPLMKFDIEGAEIEVLTRCLNMGICPRQILVEFDELNLPSVEGFARVTRIDKLLKNRGYKILETDGEADFLYYKSSSEMN